MGAPALLSRQCADGHHFRELQDVPRLYRVDELGVEDPALVRGAYVLEPLQEVLDPLDAELQVLFDPVYPAELRHRVLQVRQQLRGGFLTVGCEQGCYVALDLSQVLVREVHELRPLRVVPGGYPRLFPVDNGVQQRVRAEPVRPVDGDAGAFSRREKPRDRSVLGIRDHIPVYRCRKPAHRVVRGRLYRHRVRDRIHADEVKRQSVNLRQLLQYLLLPQVPQVDMQEIAPANPAAFADLRLHGSGYHVPRRQLHLLRGVVLHEPLPLVVEQVPALAARALGDEDAMLVQSRRVELNELHVLERESSVEEHPETVPCVRRRVGRDLEGSPVPARGEDDGLGAEGLDPAGLHVQGRHARTGPVHQSDGKREPLIVEGHLLPETLLVQRVQERVPGPVGRVARSRLAVPAKWSLRDLALRRAAEGDTHVLQLVDVLRSFVDENLHRVLIAEVVRALDRVERVLLYRVGRLVPQCGRYPSLGGARVRPQRVDLRDDGGVHLPRRLYGCPKARQTAANYDNIVLSHPITPS